MCALLNYTISISIFCVSWEDLSLIESNNRYVTSTSAQLRREGGERSKFEKRGLREIGGFGTLCQL